MNKIFSEVYGCYYGIVSRILNEAQRGIAQKEIEDIIDRYGFSETAFHLVPALLRGEWNFLEKRGDLYYSVFHGRFDRPITVTELSWLKAILSDPRIKLFLSDDRLSELDTALKDIAPICGVNDFISMDKYLDGDPYENPVYISNFRSILTACSGNDPLIISYQDEVKGLSRRVYYPFKLCYSGLEDKFRLQCAAVDARTRKSDKVILNLAKIVEVQPYETTCRVEYGELHRLFYEPTDHPPLVVEITKERNALERFLLQSASFDRKTEYDAERDVYICRISYDLADERELLIRILSFGPTVRVTEPQSFVDRIRKCLREQIRLWDNGAF